MVNNELIKTSKDIEALAKLEEIRNETDNLISKSKKEYYQNFNRKLNDSGTSNKT